MLTPWMSLKASLMASLRASTSPIMGYGGGGGEQMGLLLVQLGLYQWITKEGQGWTIGCPFGDPGGVLKVESLPVGDDAGVRKILASASPALEESEL